MSWELVGKYNTFPHDHIPEESFNERFICAICLNVMEEPVSIYPCGHIFDDGCIKAHKKSRGRAARCPKGCNTAVRRLAPLPDMKQLIRETVRTRCISEGCSAIMVVDRLPSHVKNDCQHARFRCLLKGADGTPCGAEVGRSEKAAHEDVCPNVAVQCEHDGCRKRVLRSSLEAHMEGCGMKRVTCRCDQVYRAKDADAHRQTCSETLVQCGMCQEVVPRGRMAEHMVDGRKLGTHLMALSQRYPAMEARVQSLEKKNRELTDEVEALKRRLPAAEENDSDDEDDENEDANRKDDEDDDDEDEDDDDDEHDAMSRAGLSVDDGDDEGDGSDSEGHEELEDDDDVDDDDGDDAGGSGSRSGSEGGSSSGDEVEQMMDDDEIISQLSTALDHNHHGHHHHHHSSSSSSSTSSNSESSSSSSESSSSESELDAESGHMQRASLRRRIRDILDTL